MNCNTPQQQTHRPEVERRRRWEKRREFDRAVQVAAVGSAHDTIINRSIYKKIEECNHIPAISTKSLLENLRRSTSNRQQSQKEVTQ